jgi:bifunctional DNA-binding transcriptional regulator/antitoxin component of YhaV-PrlF toxin-antitoxin module
MCISYTPRCRASSLNVSRHPASEQGLNPCYGKDRESEARMAKVTSKYQVTLPRRIAETYRIRPGDDIDWVAAGEVIRVIPPGKHAASQSRESQLRLFDQATERHRKRASARATGRSRNRGWSREDLYTRGRSR